MTNSRSAIAAIFTLLAITALVPSSANAQATISNSYKGEVAILSAGAKSSAVARLKTIPHVSVVNLNFRTTPRFRGNHPDPSDLKVSAGKNLKGIKRLRAALAANPATRAAISRRGLSVSRIVGVDIYSNGSIRLYVL